MMGHAALRLPLYRRRRSGSFDPRSLFALGEQGVLYDPSDFNRYMSELGPELITNGDFSGGTTGWEGFTANTTISNVSGTLKQQVASGAAAAARPTSGFATVVGRTYKLSYEVVEVGAGASSAKAYVGTSSGSTGGGASGPATNAAGQFSLFFVASATTYYLTIEHIGAVGTYTRFDNISVRELTSLSTATMFQNSTGTTPVTAVEQPVGLILDRSKGLTLGAELVTNGDFASGTGWGLGTGATISGGKLNLSAASGYVLYRNPVAGVQVGGYYEVTFTVSGYVSGSIYPYLGSTPTFGTAVSANGTYTQRFGPTSGGEVGFNSTPAFTGSIDNLSVKAITGNHASQSTEASRPVLKQDGNGKYYLFFDGTDDSLATGTIDFTATDKMSVFAGHRIVSGTGSQVMCELGTNAFSSSGFTFGQGVAAATSGLGFIMNAGSGIAAQTADRSVPYTSVSSLLLNSAQSGISNEGILRSNTTPQTYAATIGTDSGTANFPNKNLYIGNRSGSAVWFNGNLYSLIVRGALSTDAQIASTEAWVNGKTKAY